MSLLLPIGINFEAIEQLQSQVHLVSALLLADSGYAPLNPNLHTDSNGWIELTTDSDQIWVDVKKK